MTVRELLAALLNCPWDATVTIGHGPGPVGTLTPTVNGYVIIDAAAAPLNDVSAMRAERGPGREQRRPAGRASTRDVYT